MNLQKITTALILTASLFIVSPLLSQNNNIAPCWFDAYQRQNKSLITKSEQLIQNAIKQEKDNLLRSSSHNTRIIPVVVHVIHNGGAENISDAQIISQINVLNEDFRKISGTNGDGNGVDTEIEFCLAKISPDGHCTNGIVRIQSTLTNHLTYQRAQLKQLSYWDNTRYLNMYIVKSINGSSGIAGYASFPGGPPDEDGIVVRYNYFGSTGAIAAGSNGRTTTHEIGHWLGLYHTFNNGCGTDVCNDGDYVCDTPPAANPNFGCPTINSCSIEIPDLNDQIENYLDYSNDACKNMFSAGQKDRMDATLNTFRTDIWSAANVAATGCDSNYIPPTVCLPVADFTTLTTTICEGNNITFYNRSLNNPTSFLWSFPGGTPSTSTALNPVVSYTSTGMYNVSLIVANTTGSDTFTINNYITVITPLAGIPSAWSDSFENINFPANGLSIENPDNGITWERTTDAALEGNASARIQNLINTNYGQSDALVLPRIDFTALATPIKLDFKWAYARSDANYSDELIVLVSDNCGATWTQRFYRTGNALVTGPTQTTLFIPNSSQWKAASIDLSTYSTSNHVDIKIVNVTDGGNALYIDSLYLNGFNLNASDLIYNNSKDTKLTIYPNPSHNILNVGLPEMITDLLITNALGKTVINVKNINRLSYQIDVNELKSGIYIIHVKSSQNSYSSKFIKQ